MAQTDMVRMNSSKDIFISYSTMDSEVVLEFVSKLENSGITYWLDAMDIGWGENIVDRVFAGIQSSKYVVVFVSENSLKSQWVRNEITTAFKREMEGNSFKILPILTCSADSFFKIFPYLTVKKFLVLDRIENIVNELISILRGTPARSFTLHHPAAYSGRVWIRAFAIERNDNKVHRIDIRWGPWASKVQLGSKIG